MQKLKVLVPALSLCIICLITTLLLAGTHEITKTTIDDQEAAAALEQKQIIFPEGTEFDVVIQTTDISSGLEKADGSVTEISIAKDSSGEVIGYVFVSSSFGYAGDVIATTGISTSGEIVQVLITAASDTPKLGKEVEKDLFSSQFSGVSADTLTVIGTASDDSEASIDGISGATISSRAASDAVNKAQNAYQYLLAEEVIQ